jgi:hypothetical protein
VAALGRLVAEIGLDSAEFTAGIKRAEKGFADFERSIGNAATGAITSFAGQLLSLQAASALASSAVAAFTDTVKGLAALDDAAERTGATVESLAKLQVQTKISGSSFEVMESILIKLNKGLVNSGDETKGVGRALEFLNVKSKDANGVLRDGGEILFEASKKFNEFSDKGPGKAALALDLFGKAGAKELSTIKDLGENLDNLKGVFVGNTEAADKYEKAINGLAVEKEQLRRVIVSELLPAAEDFVNALLDMKKRGEGLSATIKELAADGSLERWARQGALFIAELIDKTIYAGNQFVALGKDLQGLALLAGAAFDQLAAGAASAFARITRSQAAMQEALQLEGSASDKYARAMTAFADSTAIAAKESTKFADAVLIRQIERMTASGDAATAAGGKIANYGGATAKAGRDAEDLTKKIEALLNKLRGKDTGTEADFFINIALLDKAKLSQEDYNKALSTLISIQPSVIAAEKAREERLKALAEATEGYAKSVATGYENATKVIEDHDKKINDLIKSLEAQNVSLRDEANALGLTDRERRLYNLNLEKTRALDAQMDDGQRTKITNLFNEKIAIEGAKDSYADYLKSIEDTQRVQDSIAGFFEDIFLNGKKAFENLGQTVKRFFAQMASQFASKFVLNILASVTAGGAGGLANAAGSLFGGGSGGGLGGLGSIFSGLEGPLISGLGSIFGSAGSIFAANLTSPLAALSSGIAGFVEGGLSGAISALGGFAGALGAAIPVIGAIVAIASALGVFDNETGIKIDNSVTDGRGRKDIIRGAALGDFDVSGDIGNEAFKPLIDTVLSLDKFIADNLLTEGTLNTVRANIQRISSDATDWFGFEDAAGAKVAIEKASKLFLQQRYSVAFDEIDANVGNLIRGFAGTADELIAYISKLSTGAVAVKKLNDLVPGLNISLLAFSKLSDKAQESVAALAIALSAFDTNTNETVDKIIKAQKVGSVTAYAAAGDAILGLRDKLADGTIGIEQFAEGIGQLATAYAAATAKIAEIKGALAELFAGSREGFLLAGKSNEDQYLYFQRQAEALFESLAAATDPEVIDRLARQIDAAQNRAFGLLDDKGRAELSGQFIDGNQRVESLVNARLQAAGDKLDKQNLDLKNVIREALQEFAESINASAAVIATAADTASVTSRTPLQLNVKTEVDILNGTARSEVTGN